MSMLDRLSRFVGGGAAAAAQNATEMLTRNYLQCVQRARQLARHAEMAPQEYSVAALKELAHGEDAMAERLRGALRAANAPIPTVADESLPPGALSHWARLVQDLEAHRLSARQLRETSMHFAEALPATAQLFDELCRVEQIHCERLRTLIARADPQALD